MLLIYDHESLSVYQLQQFQAKCKGCRGQNNNEQNTRQMLYTASAMFRRPVHWFNMNSFSLFLPKNWN